MSWLRSYFFQHRLSFPADKKVWFDTIDLSHCFFINFRYATQPAFRAQKILLKFVISTRYLRVIQFS